MDNPNASIVPMNQNNIPVTYLVIAYILLIWTIVWKGLALWKSAKLGQRNWFIAFIFLNPPVFTTIGILEIIYLFRFAKKRMTLKEIKTYFQTAFYTKSK